MAPQMELARAAPPLIWLACIYLTQANHNKEYNLASARQQIRILSIYLRSDKSHENAAEKGHQRRRERQGR